MKKALFLDRDGVINKEKEYLYKIENFEFLDGVFETCKYFQDRGYLIIVITNQAGIARGKYTEEDFELLSTWMTQEFKRHDIIISRIYHCPHHPDFSDKCKCRKPAPGMILKACNEWGIDPYSSIVVGDKVSDVEAGRNAGIKNLFLINTGHFIKENPSNVLILNSLTDLIPLF